MVSSSIVTLFSGHRHFHRLYLATFLGVKEQPDSSSTRLCPLKALTSESHWIPAFASSVVLERMEVWLTQTFPSRFVNDYIQL